MLKFSVNGYGVSEVQGARTDVATSDGHTDRVVHDVRVQCHVSEYAQVNNDFIV